jgi:hypothetical protein
MAATARAVDLTNVKEAGVFRQRRKPSGDYRAKIVKADDHQSNDKSKAVGWVMTVQVEGDARSTYPVYLSPEEKQAWKVRQICVAAGLNVKTARVRFDPNKLVGKMIGVHLEDDEYEGRLKSIIDDMFPVSEVGANADEDVPDGEEIDDEDIDTGVDDDEEEVEEVPEPPKRRRRKPAPEPEPEEEEEVEEEEEPPPPPRKRVRKAAPPPPEDDDDEEEEEEVAPPPRRRRAAAPPAKSVGGRRVAKARTVEEDDDLDDLEVDDLD